MSMSQFPPSAHISFSKAVTSFAGLCHTWCSYGSSHLKEDERQRDAVIPKRNSFLLSFVLGLLSNWSTPLSPKSKRWINLISHSFSPLLSFRKLYPLSSFIPASLYFAHMHTDCYLTLGESDTMADNQFLIAATIHLKSLTVCLCHHWARVSPFCSGMLLSICVPRI